MLPFGMIVLKIGKCLDLEYLAVDRSINQF